MWISSGLCVLAFAFSNAAQRLSVVLNACYVSTIRYRPRLHREKTPRPQELTYVNYSGAKTIEN